MTQTVTIIGKVGGVVCKYEIDEVMHTPIQIVVPGFSFLNKKEIVEDLMKRMPDGAMRQLKKMHRVDLIKLHHGLGTEIRNIYGMWYEENPHTSNWDLLGDTHPDQYSFAVIEALYDTLTTPQDPHAVYAAYDSAMKGLI